jgi:hypothetical protein
MLNREKLVKIGGMTYTASVFVITTKSKGTATFAYETTVIQHMLE